ncbi:MAG: hypothetical protein RBS80_31405 [Thermoguttaceae bacterium]|nr:hypothetical protein [Thermoguttaceae bacterium]
MLNRGVGKMGLFAEERDFEAELAAPTAAGGAWLAFRRRRLAGAYRKAVGPRIDASPARSSLAFCITIRVKTPDPP